MDGMDDMDMRPKTRSTRRSFLKRGAVAAAGAVGCPAFAQGKAKDRPPNIVYIVCDQMRGDALSCLGSPNVSTPNLDRMAKDGVLFERCFSNNPVCVPSRVTAFTGRHPHEHGHLTNHSRALPHSTRDSMLEHFQERGYRLGWIGKNHTFRKDVLRKLDVSSIRAREPFRKYSPEVTPWWHSDMSWPEEKCFASLNTRESVRFLRGAKRDEPFFLHLSYFDPHPPYFAPSACAARRKAEDMSLPANIPAEKLGPRLAESARAMGFGEMGEAGLRDTMRYYYASIEWGVDQQVGQVLKALEETGQEQNTIVVFTSDHGDFMGHHRMVRKGMFLYDSLLHVPMIWYAPGRIAKGHRVRNLAQGVDLFPTLVDMSGGEVPEDLPGRSQKPFIEGKSETNENDCVFASATYSDLPKDYFDKPEQYAEKERGKPLHSRVLDLTCGDTCRTAMVRTQEWKLILSESRAAELYHMRGGTVEQENVIDQRSAESIRRELEGKLERQWRW